MDRPKVRRQEHTRGVLEYHAIEMCIANEVSHVFVLRLATIRDAVRGQGRPRCAQRKSVRVGIPSAHESRIVLPISDIWPQRQVVRERRQPAVVPRPGWLPCQSVHPWRVRSTYARDRGVQYNVTILC